MVPTNALVGKNGLMQELELKGGIGEKHPPEGKNNFLKIQQPPSPKNLSFISGAEIVALAPEKLTPVNPILR